MARHYDENGDLIAQDDMRLRQVGWIIYGGPNDGKMVPKHEDIDRTVPIGGFAPVYVEVGD